MKIVIAGAGAVGYNLARELSDDRHDITVIESDPALIQALREKVDVHALAGSATDVNVLKSAQIQDADVFIAVTNSDEVNIVASVIAHAMGAKRRIARVRNPHLAAKEPLVNKREFHINRLVNPDALAAETLEHFIQSPGVRFRAEFAEGEVLMRAFKVPAESPIAGVTLSELGERFPGRPFLVVAVEREGGILIPRGKDILRTDDIVYLLMLKDAEGRFLELVGQVGRKVRRVVVFGVTPVALDLIDRIDGLVEKVVLVDDRRNEAERAADRFRDVLVLHGWVCDEEIVRELDFKNVDVFVAAAMDDRMNLVAALFAKQRGAQRVMVLAREPDVVPLMRALDFDAVVNARLLAVSETLRFVRPGKVLSVQKIGEGGAEAIELIVRKGSKAAEKSLRELHLPSGAIVGAVFRDGTAFLPTGDTVLEVGDDIVAFVLGDVRDSVERMFAGSKSLRFGA